jgi:hypothetical protein
MLARPTGRWSLKAQRARPSSPKDVRNLTFLKHSTGNCRDRRIGGRGLEPVLVLPGKLRFTKFFSDIGEIASRNLLDGFKATAEQLPDVFKRPMSKT